MHLLKRRNNFDISDWYILLHFTVILCTELFQDFVLILDSFLISNKYILSIIFWLYNIFSCILAIQRMKFILFRRFFCQQLIFHILYIVIDHFLSLISVHYSDCSHNISTRGTLYMWNTLLCYQIFYLEWKRWRTSVVIFQIVIQKY